MSLAFFHLFSRKLRLGNPWKYKLPLLLSFTYFMLLVGNVSTKIATFSFLCAVATSLGFAGFGYLTNDLGDRKVDATAGKENLTINMKPIIIILLLSLFVLIALLPWLYLPHDSISMVLILIELALFVLYAFPPFRLKEKGILGLITDALYAHVVPAILAIWTFHLVGGKSYNHFIGFALGLVVWQFISGLRNILSHQLKDFENDRISKVKTVATRYGFDKANDFMGNYLVPLELISFIAFLFLIQYQLYFIGFVILSYWVVAFMIFVDRKDDKIETRNKHFTNLILDDLYVKWFPLIILCGMIDHPIEIRYILACHVLLFTDIPRRSYQYLKNKI